MSDSAPIMKLVGSFDEAQSELPQPSGRWLPINVAAERAGKNAGLIRRWITEQGWEESGLARKVKLASGQPGWEVDEAAFPAFARIKSSEQLTDTFRTSKAFAELSQELRDRALQRESILSEWDRKLVAGRELGMSESDVTHRLLKDLHIRGIKSSRAGLFNWRKAYRESGLEGLVDRWGKRQSPDASQFFELAKELYLGSQIPKQKAFDCAVYEANKPHNNWNKMSYRDFCRKLDQIPAVVIAKRRAGEKEFVAMYEPSIQRDYSQLSSNQWWCSDHHRMDVMVMVGTNKNGEPVYDRPWLHAWQDLRSRKIVAWTIQVAAPNASTILRTFVAGVREHGRPGTVYIDNGKDFDSRTLQGVTKHQRRRGKNPNDLSPSELARVGGAFNMIGCRIEHTWTYHGQSKPIERFFGTLCSRFSKLWDTYTGKDTLSKPDALKKHLEAGNAPTLDEITQAFSEWLHTDYHNRIHTGDAMNGQTPDQVYSACLDRVDRVPEQLLEFATFERVGPVTVHKNGVTWKGLFYGWSMDELIIRQKQKVLLAIDDRTASHVYVLDLDGGLICRAPVQQKIAYGADKSIIIEAIKLKKNARKAVAEYNEQKTRVTMDVADLSLQAAKDKAEQTVAAQSPDTNPPPSVRQVQTPFDGQSNAIDKAVNQDQYRQAAGAETARVAGSGNFNYAARQRADDDAASLGFTYRTRREDSHE